MFHKVLIANRGEIACRIQRTCRRLGIGTVAVYSAADAAARHVALADEAYHIGDAEATASYLRGEVILEAARQSGAEAIHPGYGFLSENAGFAEDCRAAGLVFIGPPPEAIRAMGGKSEAKALMAEAGVPLTPGYHGEDQDPARLLREAEAIGFPVLLKASAGGGGKGMRVVEAASQFEAALASAQREARAAFGDDRMLIEKYLSRPRHVEIQIFADSHGNHVHLFERDCSIQRRHQKVIEEAPAPGMSQDLRHRMGDAALAAARAIGYVGAGTVEFLLDHDGQFYFMEMNTRLQVEHPVTEMITGQDLVEWQLRVAAGGYLLLSQDDLVINGHAIEARIYAEDPSRDFLPGSGVLRHLRPPPEDAHVRIDSGFAAGDQVPVQYDPMIAKLIVWDHHRGLAIARLRQALADYQLAGMTTNLDFLAAIAGHPAFAAADLDTRFIERHRHDLIPEHRPASDRVLALAALFIMLRRQRQAAQQAAVSGDPHSPWHQASGWRMNDDNHHDLVLRDADQLVTLVVHFRGASRFRIETPGGVLDASGELDASGDLSADLGGVRLRATMVSHGDELTVICQGHSHHFEVFDPMALGTDEEAYEGGLSAPMPGRVVAVMATPGKQVAAGEALLVLEAMKMEHTVTAPHAGTVEEILFTVGDQVEEGVALVSLLPLPEDAEPSNQES